MVGWLRNDSVPESRHRQRGAHPRSSRPRLRGSAQCDASLFHLHRALGALFSKRKTFTPKILREDPMRNPPTPGDDKYAVIPIFQPLFFPFLVSPLTSHSFLR
ncbi:hypothetical protein BJX66DRAFT_217853 [Aspergillus keveii]|uniref:Uncharacterized protein n=1 Tax=Aspergillus keveii TaxID=714993 RepID=A0ABR4G460_9EURO